MKRPLALVGFSYLLGQAAAVFFGESISWYLAAGCLLFFIVSLLIPRLRREKAVPIACIAAGIACVAYGLGQMWLVRPVEFLDGRDVEVSGSICELPYQKDGRYYYEIQTDQVEMEGAPQSIHIQITATHALDAGVYDRVTGKIRLFVPERGSGLDSAAYYQSKGIRLTGFLYEYEPFSIQSPDHYPPYYYALKAREEILHRIRLLFPSEQSGMAAGVLLGAKEQMAQETQEDFRRIGVSHLLAVSGLHTAVITQCLLHLFLFLRLRRRMAAGLSIVGVIAFMAVTGFSPSVMRAGLMSILMLLGMMIYREPDSLNSLGAAVGILTVANPFAAGDVGLLLSFACTLGILLVSGKLLNKWNQKLLSRISHGKRIWKWIGDSTAVTVSATLFTIPVILLTFQEFSLVSILANLLLAGPAMLMMIGTMAAVLLSFTGVFSFLAMPFLFLSSLLIQYLQACASCLADIPFASLSVGEDFLLLWLMGTLVLLAVVWWSPTRSNRRIAAWFSCLLLIFGGVCQWVFHRNSVEVAILDVGDGCAVTLSYQGHGAVISCGGGRYAPKAVQRYFREQNVRSLDYMVLPSVEQEGEQGAYQVILSYPPRLLELPEEAREEERLWNSMHVAQEAAMVSGQTQVDLWGKVSVYTDMKNGYTHLSIGDLQITVDPTGKAETPGLDSHFYITGLPDARGGEISSQYAVFSVSEETAREGIIRYTPEAGEIFVTGGQGNLVLEQDSSGAVSIRRE